MVASDEDTTPTYALDALVANLSIDATPVGNIGGDAGGDAREGRTAQEAERKFLAEFGLTSSTGANASSTPQGQDDALCGSGCAGRHRRLRWPEITAPRPRDGRRGPVEPRRARLRERRGAAGDLRGLLLGARG